ncbi:MAG: hypothetical protein H2058_17110 [Muricauda sp.]|nr:hypothetical protein [Allomuricauda sp.]MBA4746962.1 hypothetical protein [Allomuricauda sp.]
MDKNEDKKWEVFVDRIMEDAPLESPSLDFTQNVLQKLETETHNEVFQYKPILSGRVLSLVFAAFVAILVLVGMRFGLDDGQGWFKNLQMEAWFKNSWGWMENYTSSKVMVYGFLFLGLMFFAQVTWLKKYLNRTAF